MMHDDRRGRLLRIEHKLLGEFHADPLGSEQIEKLGLVFNIRTCRVTKAVARTLITLMEKLREFRSVAGRNPQLLPYSLVPPLGQRLGGLDRQPVE